MRGKWEVGLTPTGRRGLTMGFNASVMACVEFGLMMRMCDILCCRCIAGRENSDLAVSLQIVVGRLSLGVFGDIQLKNGGGGVGGKKR